MGKGARNRKNRKQALHVKITTGDERPIKSIARQLRRNPNVR